MSESLFGRGTLLEAARAARLGTLINRPLNAFNGRRMTRLASFDDFPPGATESALRDDAIRAMAGLELAC